MLNFNRRDGAPDPKDAGKFALKPALYESPAAQAQTPPGGRNAAAQAPARAEPVRTEPATAPAAPGPAAAPASAPVATASAPAAEGSTLAVGTNIKLKGVEISDCDHLVIEGRVEATVQSKAMHIEQPGTLTGTAHIDVAEVRGEFTGELTVRTRLVVHATGRVSGKIRYGSLVVEQGGVLSGDVKALDASGAERAPANDAARPPIGAAEPVARRA